MELVGGIIYNSVSLLADSFHVLVDVVSLILSYLTVYLASKPANSKYTYGYHSMEAITGFVNGVLLGGTTLLIFFDAFERIINPQLIQFEGVFVVAIIGLVANLLSAKFLHSTVHEHSHNNSRGYENHDKVKHEHNVEGKSELPEIKSDMSLNVESAYLHVLGDTMSSVAVIIAAVVIAYTGFTLIDPLVAILIGLILVRGTYRVIKRSVDMIMNKSTHDIENIRRMLLNYDEIVDVHDIHAWRLCSHLNIFTAHVKVKDLNDFECVASEIDRKLNNLGFDHITIQAETDGRTCFTAHEHKE